MKTKKTFTVILMSLVLILISCKSETSKTDSETNDSTETIMPTSKGRYAMKSGILEYKTEMMNMEMKQTLTFDDYGNKEVTDVEMEMMGTKIHTVTITKDGFIYSLNMEKKTATKMNGKSPNIDFENLGEEMVKDMNLKKLGTENFLGKTCEKMSIDYKKMNMKGIYLIYKGLPLMADTQMGSTKMKLIGVKFIEDAAIPAETFDIPADFTITEMK